MCPPAISGSKVPNGENMMVRLCCAGLQPAVTKCMGTAARRCCAGLQLKVHKRFVMAVQREGLACRNYRRGSSEKIWLRQGGSSEWKRVKESEGAQIIRDSSEK